MLNLIILLVIALGINAVMFIPAYRFKTDKLTDISYAVTFGVLTLYSLFSDGITLPKVLLAVMVGAWAIRLGSFLLNRIRKIGKDKRFDGMREDFWRFSRFWLLQGVTVFIIFIPAALFFQSEVMQFSILSAIGFFVWLSGLLLEALADYQKYSFVIRPENKNRWIAEGPWKYSRHPNYLGEILVWAGVWIFVFPALSITEAMISLISPVYITLLLLFVSGIPMLEKSADKKWGKDPSYIAYKNRTGILLPKHTLPLLCSVVIAQAAGGIGAVFTASGVGSWYMEITKPSWNPPDWVFGPVWITLYTLMGIAAFLVWKKREHRVAMSALTFYVIQLTLNSLWSILFFGLRSPGIAFAEILILLTMIIINTWYFWKVDKAAAFLMIPYIAWVGFASVLNFTIWQLN